MSLITQCPACATYFRVVPDQLRISDGWVRCGQCDEVFDANASVRSEAQMEAAAAAPVPPTDAPVDPQAARHATSLPDADDHQSAPDALPSEASAWDDAPQDTQHLGLHHASRNVSSDAAADPFLDRSPLELSADFSTALVGADLDASVEAAAHQENNERRYMQAFAPAAEEDPKLSFMKPVRKPSRWRRPWVRAGLSVLGLLLLAGLGLQVVVHERDRLAVQYPEYRGALQAVLEPLGLELRPLRQIESVVIDSSAFTKVRNEVYKLSFSLRNTAALSVATPAMELTLTDMQDQVLLRRVLYPKDFAKLPEVLAPGAEQGAVLSVALRSPVPQDKVAGYRLLAFYP